MKYSTIIYIVFLIVSFTPIGCESSGSTDPIEPQADIPDIGMELSVVLDDDQVCQLYKVTSVEPRENGFFIGINTKGFPPYYHEGSIHVVPTPNHGSNSGESAEIETMSTPPKSSISGTQLSDILSTINADIRSKIPMVESLTKSKVKYTQYQTTGSAVLYVQAAYALKNGRFYRMQFTYDQTFFESFDVNLSQ